MSLQPLGNALRSSQRLQQAKAKRKLNRRNLRSSEKGTYKELSVATCTRRQARARPWDKVTTVKLGLCRTRSEAGLLMIGIAKV
jgi:hypothetical protein